MDDRAALALWVSIALVMIVVGLLLVLNGGGS
jgi:hypothetical protein